MNEGGSPGSGDGPRVLVVDDDATLRKTLGLNLRARGYTADLAGTGEAALQMAASHHPDVIILDLGLPRLNGLEVISGLRGWSSVPIVVLSGRDAESMKVKALDLGADDYLTEPFGMDELFARIRAATRRAVVPEGDPVVPHPGLHHRLRRQTSAARRRTGTTHPPAVAHRRGAGPQPRPASHLQRTARRRLGPGYATETNYLHGLVMPTSGNASSRAPPNPATSSPNPEWATGSNSPTVCARTRTPRSNRLLRSRWDRVAPR